MKLLSTTFILFLLLCPFKSSLLPGADAQGWTWGREGTGAQCEGWPVATDRAGNVFAAGVKHDAAPVINFGSGVATPSGTAGQTYVAWVKYDNAGNPLWAGSTLDGISWLNSIATDPSGNLIVYGSFLSPTIRIGSFTLTNPVPASPQFFIAKIDPSGTVLWAINDGSNILMYSLNVSGAAILGQGGIATDNAGNIYISGGFGGPAGTYSMSIGTTTLSGSGGYDGFVAKYTPSGTFVWASAIGGSRHEYTLGVTVSSTGNVYICGGSYSPSLTLGASIITNPGTNIFAFIAEFSPAGVPLWGDAGPSGDPSFAISMTSDNFGNVYMTGAFGATSLTLGGTTITRTYPACAPALALFLVQYSPAHTVTWGKTIGSPTKRVWGCSVAMASCGQVWVCGSYGEAADIDGHILPVVTSSGGSDPAFIAGYNLTGGVAGYAGILTGGDDQLGLACDAHGNVFLCADVKYATTVGPDFFPTPPGTDEYIYVAKYANTAAMPDTNYVYHDTTLCGGGGIVLDAPPGYVNYYWDNGATAPSTTVAGSGTYVVYCVRCGDTTLAASFHIVITGGDTTSASRDTAVCGSGGVILWGDNGYTDYRWNTGGTSVSESVTGSGTYWVVQSKDCDSRIDTFHLVLKSVPSVFLGNDTVLCEGSGLQLNSPQVPGVTYNWSTGSTDSEITVSVSGDYSLTVDDNGCAASDAIHVQFNAPAGSFSLGPDTVLCDGQEYTLSSGNEASVWNTGQHGASIIVSRAGTFIAHVKSGCGIVSDTVQIDYGHCLINLPNAFTPNNDGKNDVFRVYGSLLDHFMHFSLAVYNRFGERVCFTEDIYSGWDGTHNGTPQDLGTYYYMVRYDLNGRHHMLKGDVTLVR